jgi:hypothetical protein
VLVRAQQLEIQFADALQGVFEFVVVAQPLLDESFLFRLITRALTLNQGASRFGLVIFS